MIRSGLPSRFAAIPGWAARLLLAGLILLIGWGIANPPLLPPGGQPGAGDATLYRTVSARVAAGEAYHPAALSEQRTRGYPVRPFSAVRPPLLAEIGAALGPEGAELLFRLLGVIAAGATVMRIAPTLASPIREAAILLAATAGGVLLQPGMWIWHEAWAGLLVVLALALRDERSWRLAVLAGLAAALIRELALPALFVMAICAAIDHRREEAVAWAAAATIALAALGWHAALVMAGWTPQDFVSPGWLMASGWRFDLALARHCAVFIAFPAWMTAIGLPLALLGWAGWRNGYALRAALIVFGWTGAFLIIGRPDNDYWGFLLTPILPVGIALAPAALRDIVRAALPGPGRRSSAATQRQQISQQI